LELAGEKQLGLDGGGTRWKARKQLGLDGGGTRWKARKQLELKGQKVESKQ
jgi:hypothetical protein